LIDAPHFVGNGEPTLGAHFLLNEFHGKDGGQVLGSDGLAGARMEIGRQGGGQIRQEIIPLLGHFRLAQVDFIRLHIISP